jgi:hypothetical protein
MSRRSTSSSNKKSQLTTYALAFIMTVIILVAGKSYLNKQAQHFANLNDLSLVDLKDNGTSLSGNEYRIKGKIEERTILKNERGLLVSIKSDATDAATGIIPVHIPPSIDRINIERGQNYSFKIEVNREGLPVAKDIKAE